MQICKTIAEMRAAVDGLRARGRVGFVPTMGALHAGHMALVARAAELSDAVCVTIFVNPTQFENPDDLSNYPRRLEEDLDQLRTAGVTAVLVPDPAEIYPEGAETIVETTRLGNMLHGKTRPGHYRGVTTVVTKLFNIIQPDIACFGEKDYQQLVIIRRMVRDLLMPVEIIGVPTVREADGLALSSRNVRLSEADRAAAVVLNQSLDLAERLVAAGTTAGELFAAVHDHITSETRAHDPVVDIAAAEDLSEITGIIRTPVALMISAKFGDVMLIDQRVAHPQEK